MVAVVVVVAVVDGVKFLVKFSVLDCIKTATTTATTVSDSIDTNNHKTNHSADVVVSFDTTLEGAESWVCNSYDSYYTEESLCFHNNSCCYSQISNKC